MQAFDALTLKAVVHEITPLLTKARLDKSQQTARDELCLTFRQPGGLYHLLLSANSAMGRICLLDKAKTSKLKSQSAFGLALRKHLVSAQLVSISAVVGERIVELTFSAVDELGTRSLKVLTVEVMAKHSNLVFWDKESERIIVASHNVTAEMSSKREIASGLRYVRPPSQTKPNIFTVDSTEVKNILESSLPTELSGEDFLLSKFSGLGRPLAEELAESLDLSANEKEITANLWKKLDQIQKLQNLIPAMKLDLTRYTLFGWAKNGELAEWQEFDSVNLLVASYYHQLEDRVHLNHIREELKSTIKSEEKRLSSRLAVSVEQKESACDFEKYKQYGDLLLANIANMKPGADEIIVDNFYSEAGEQLTIALDPNLSPSQNAQANYRLFSKNKSRFEAAQKHIDQTSQRIAILKDCLTDLEVSTSLEDLAQVKIRYSGRDMTQAKILNKDSGGGKPIMFGSSDGLTILVGRNRKENELLLSNAKPHEIWLHVLGVPGSHVLIRLPSSKQDPPANTLKEAAFAAAYFSRAKTSGIARVTYTQIRHVKKLGPPGVVSYEKEKTIEVDLSTSMPQALKEAIAKRQIS